MKRAGFLTASLASAAFPLTVSAATSAHLEDHSGRLDSVLVLSGGGARGAYQAGVIEGIRRKAGVADGTRIPGVDAVCGTSIGSINGWFLATGQYSKLSELWHGIGSERIFEVKRRFAATTKPGAFILTRIIAALALAQGLTKNVQGILDGAALEVWLAKHIDPNVPVLIPMVYTATNLDRERAELFFRLPFVVVSDSDRRAALARIRSTVGQRAVLRPATDGVLLATMRASIAIPILFDPIVLASPEGSLDRYVDGGIADNDPIDVGQALAKAVYTVMVDPEQPAREPYVNALQIGVGSFGVAQRRILDASLRSAYLQTRAKRLLMTGSLSGDQRRVYDAILDADLFTIQPQTELPVDVVEFDRQEKIDAAYDAGVRAMERGWSAYTIPDAAI